jgi:hypothetical protein
MRRCINRSRLVRLRLARRGRAGAACGRGAAAASAATASAFQMALILHILPLVGVGEASFFAVMNGRFAQPAFSAVKQSYCMQVDVGVMVTGRSGMHTAQSMHSSGSITSMFGLAGSVHQAHVTQSVYLPDAGFGDDGSGVFGRKLPGAILAEAWAGLVATP